MIRTTNPGDIHDILEIINDAATAYRGVIPADRLHEPYMSVEELQQQLVEGVRFSCYVDQGRMLGVMGMQSKADVDLVRHAYVRTANRGSGIGMRLLRELMQHTDKPVLIGTWRAADWAIRFYERNGFRVVEEQEKNRLLKKYWVIPDRQVETSVVLVSENYSSALSF